MMDSNLQLETEINSLLFCQGLLSQQHRATEQVSQDFDIRGARASSYWLIVTWESQGTHVGYTIFSLLTLSNL